MLKGATIHFYCLYLMNHTSVLIIECLELNWLCKHIKRIRSSQPAIPVLNWVKHESFPESIVKGYLRYKTTLCHKAVRDVQLMNFFIWKKKKKCLVLEISRFLYFCETRRFQNSWRHHKHCCIMQFTPILISFEF